MGGRCSSVVKHLPYVAKALCSSLEREAGLEIMKGYAYCYVLLEV